MDYSQDEKRRAHDRLRLDIFAMDASRSALPNDWTSWATAEAQLKELSKARSLSLTLQDVDCRMLKQLWTSTKGLIQRGKTGRQYSTDEELQVLKRERYIRSYMVRAYEIALICGIASYLGSAILESGDMAYDFKIELPTFMEIAEMGSLAAKFCMEGCEELDLEMQEKRGKLAALLKAAVLTRWPLPEQYSQQMSELRDFCDTKDGSWNAIHYSQARKICSTDDTSIARTTPGSFSLIITAWPPSVSLSLTWGGSSSGVSASKATDTGAESLTSTTLSSRPAHH